MVVSNLLKMGSTIPILWWFTVLIAMTVGPAHCVSEFSRWTRWTRPLGVLPLESDNQGKQSSKSEGLSISKTTPVAEALNAGTLTPIEKYDDNRGFLIGETTPVWDAYEAGSSTPTNYSYHNKWLVKQAIDEWMPLREKADYSNIRLTRQESWKGFSDRNVKDVPTNLTSVEHDLHIFVAMDYPEQWPTDKKDEEKYMKEKIVYAVAFWNAIHMRLRTTRNPRLRIRIDGIIFVHWENRQTGMNLDLTDALLKTYMHSQNLWPTKSGVPVDFPRAVFTMTNSNQPKKSERWNVRKDASGLSGRQLIGVIYDDLKFYGMVGFTAEDQDMMRLLASSSTSNLRPAAYIQPGNPIVNPPMPGEVMPANKQCEAFGWDEKNEVVAEFNWCNTFVCKNPSSWSGGWFADNYRDAVDGTYCYRDKICMNRECVTKTDNTLKY